MGYFSDQVQVQRKGDTNLVRISIRVSEMRVDEYVLVDKELIKPFLEHPIPLDWSGMGVVQIKSRPLHRDVLVKFQYGLKAEVHLLPMVAFSILQSQVRALLDGV